MPTPVPVITVQLTRLGGEVQALAVRSPIGEPKGTFAPPYGGPYQREAVSLALEAVNFDLPRWEQVRDKFQALKDLELGDEQGFRENMCERIGGTLYGALFPPNGMRRALHAALNAGSDRRPARVELRFDANATDLGAYPWELLHDDTRGFLFSGRRASLIRYVACELPPPELLETDTLKLLLITARPIDPELCPLPDVESASIQEGLAERIREGHVQLAPLEPASPAHSTWDLLSTYLIKHRGGHAPHVLHFDGHGGFGRRCPPQPEGCGALNPANASKCTACKHRLTGPAQGYLAFEGRNKRPQWISARELGNLLAGAGVRLAVLTACKSAVVAGESVFTGMGPALIQAGVPGVVAMQFSIAAGAAMQFAEMFYLSLGERSPLPVAMGQARAALFASHPTAWYRPVLYLRTDEENQEGRLFTAGKRRAHQKEHAEARKRGQSARTPPASAREPVAVPKDQLVQALLACPTMSNRDTRDVVVNELPLEIRGNIRRYAADRFDVTGIVTTCSNYTHGIEQLVEILRRYEGDSVPMQRVEELLR